MSAPANYSGHAYSPAGDKGRFVLPSTLRKILKESSGGNKTLCLAAHGTYDCLIGFGLSRVDKLHAQLEKEEERAIRMQDETFDHDARAQQLFGYEQVPFDDSGRFVMPEYLRELGMVEDGLFFQGAGDFFLIWNPEELMRKDSSFKGAQAACRSLKAEAEAKAAAKKGRGK